MVVLVLLRGLQVLVPDLALGHVVVEITLVARRSACVDFNSEVSQRAKEIAIVRNQHQSAVVRLEIFLEPVYCGKVEVV